MHGVLIFVMCLWLPQPEPAVQCSPPPLSEALDITSRVAALRRDMPSTLGQLDFPFTEAELQNVLSQLPLHRAAGPDGLPYDVFVVDDDCLRAALLTFFELVRHWTVVPSIWRSARERPLHKSAQYGCSASYRNSQTCSVPGCCCRCARPPVQTMPYALFPRRKSWHMHVPMTRPCGVPSSSAWGAPPKPRRRMREALRRCLPIWGAWGLHSAERTSPAAYWAGLADALPVIDARLPSFAERYRVALEGGGDDIPNLRAAAECRELLQAEGWEACPSWRAILQSEPARPRQSTPAPETGRMAGSFTRRALATNTFATTCCCQPCCQAPGPWYARSRDLMQGRGSPLYQQSRQPR